MVSFGTQLRLQALLYNNSIILWARIRRQPDFFFVAQRSIYIILSIILRTANNSENGTKDRIIQHWKRNERQMVIEESGPNKTHWFVMQNAAFERLLKVNFLFLGEFRPKAVNLRLTYAAFCASPNLCISNFTSFDNQVCLTGDALWFVVSSALIKSRETPDTNTVSFPLFPSRPCTWTGNNVFGRRAYECWLKRKFK